MRQKEHEPLITLFKRRQSTVHRTQSVKVTSLSSLNTKRIIKNIDWVLAVEGITFNTHSVIVSSPPCYTAATKIPLPLLMILKCTQNKEI